MKTPQIISDSYSISEETYDFQYFLDLSGEICRRVQHKDHLSDDEIIILSLAAAQMTLAKYIEPGERDSDVILDHILRLLDHDDLNKAILSKMVVMLSSYAPQSRTREDAPSGKMVEQLGVYSDPEEPAPDPDPITARNALKSIIN